MVCVIIIIVYCIFLYSMVEDGRLAFTPNHHTGIVHPFLSFSLFIYKCIKCILYTVICMLYVYKTLSLYIPRHGPTVLCHMCHHCQLLLFLYLSLYLYYYCYTSPPLSLSLTLSSIHPHRKHTLGHRKRHYQLRL